MLLRNTLKYLNRMVVFGILLIWVVTVAAPVEAMRVTGHNGTEIGSSSPQTVLTIYNETDCEIVFNYLPGNRFERVISRRIQVIIYEDVKALQTLFVDRPSTYFIPPYDRFEYVGLMGPCPKLAKDSMLGEWGFGIKPPGSSQMTEFRLWLHGDTSFTTPYDLDWSLNGHQANVQNWLVGNGLDIPNTNGIKTREEDRLSRYAVQSRINGKWYIFSMLLGRRAEGTIKSDPSHLVIVIQEANSEMKTVNM